MLINLCEIFLYVTQNLTLSRYESKFAEVVGTFGALHSTDDVCLTKLCLQFV